jgi:transposase
LQQELALYDAYQVQLAACDTRIEQCLSNFEVISEIVLPVAGSPRRKPQDHQPAFDLQTHLHRISGVDFTRIDGMGELTVQIILSEVGLDASRFPSIKHFTSWLGLCPGSCITGGRVKNSRTRRVVNRAANAFRMAAVAADKTRSALGAFYRRLRTRLGTPKAITATAHKLARIFYRLWSSGGSYDDSGINYYEQRYQEQIVKGLRKKAHAMGFDLVATPSTQIVS